MSAAVEAHGVRKEYGSLIALEDLSFAVEAGEILGGLGLAAICSGGGQGDALVIDV